MHQRPPRRVAHRYVAADHPVMQLYRRGLVKRTRRGVVEAVHEKAWKAIEDEMARVMSGLTHRVSR